MRVALFGTPQFAVPVLEAMIRDPETEVAAVVTQCDRPVGRKAVMTPPPIKTAAQQYQIPVLQIEKINKEESLEQLRALSCDLFVTAAYGQILSQKLLDIPPQGVVNVHASLLPAYRGASPIAWSILCGDRETGVTTMFTDAGMDTGDIILQRRIPIEDMDTTQTLTEKLSLLGADLLIETLHGITEKTVPRIPQDSQKATKTPILNKTHGRMDLSRTFRELDCQIRAMTPWPGTWTTLDGKTLKIFGIRRVDGSGAPGTVIDDKLGIACGDGAFRPLEVQLEGSKRMPLDVFLRGRKIEKGTVLGDEK